MTTSMIDIQKAILRIIAFYDVFEFPLTAEEIVESRNVYKVESDINVVATTAQDDKTSLRVFRAELETMTAEGILEREEVFYCLKGRRDIVRQRKMRYPISLQKMLKSNKWIRMLRVLPFVRAIYYAGSVAMENANKDSDIDLAIVVKTGRAWSARFFVNAVLAMLGRRVYGSHWVGKNLWAYAVRFFKPHSNVEAKDTNRGKNTFCTAFFMDESVDPKTILANDRQFQFWTERWMPVSWNMEHGTGNKRLWERFVGLIPERVFRWLQERALMPEPLRKLALTQNGDVILTDAVIKLHSVDRRREYEQRYQSILSLLTVSPSDENESNGVQIEKLFEKI